MLKVYMHFHERFSKEYVLRQDSGATNEEEEEQKRAIFAHSEALTHIQKCLETRTSESLAQTLLSADEASAHAKIFSLSRLRCSFGEPPPLMASVLWQGWVPLPDSGLLQAGLQERGHRLQEDEPFPAHLRPLRYWRCRLAEEEVQGVRERWQRGRNLLATPRARHLPVLGERVPHHLRKYFRIFLFSLCGSMGIGFGVIKMITPTLTNYKKININ